LLSGGDEVTALDDLSTGSLENVASIRSDHRFSLHVGSVMDAALVAELVDGADVIVHLAAAVGVKLIVDSPVRTIETNIRGTEVVLEAASARRRRTLVASTSEVYGKSAQVPFREDQDLVLGPPLKGRWSYAASKLVDEFLALAYWKERRLPATVVRLFNTVGPRQTGRYGMVVPTFVRQALQGRPITVHQTGGQSRCFAHVADIVPALRQLCLLERAAGEVFNLGSTEEVSIGDLALRVRARCGSDSPIHYVDYEKAYESGFEDMARRLPDIGKARAWIGFRPSRCLDDILSDVIEFERRSSAPP
jgi:UDP-glucose 4-epimerase